MGAGARAVSLGLFYGTHVSGLAPVLELSPGATVAVDGAVRINGVTGNGFGVPVTYVVMPEDGIGEA